MFYLRCLPFAPPTLQDTPRLSVPLRPAHEHCVELTERFQRSAQLPSHHLTGPALQADPTPQWDGREKQSRSISRSACPCRPSGKFLLSTNNDFKSLPPTIPARRSIRPALWLWLVFPPRSFYRSLMSSTKLISRLFDSYTKPLRRVIRLTGRRRKGMV